MARRCVLRRLFGVRVRLTWDTKKRDVSIEPDESDLATVDMDDVVKLFEAVSAWSDDFVKRWPGWKINGYSSREKDDDNDEVEERADQELEVPLREREEAEAVLQADFANAGEYRSVPDEPEGGVGSS